MIRNQIQLTISDFINKHGVQVLLAVESGSRLWGFESKDSDYDIRMIFVRPKSSYLSLSERKDNYENVTGLIDYQAWDLKKALNLAKKSNTSLFEWLEATDIYTEKTGFKEDMKLVRDRFFSPYLAITAYAGMAQGNFREYLRGDLVRAKKYLYVIRPLLACEHIKNTGTMPPIHIDDLVKMYCPENILPDLLNILSLKRTGVEMDNMPRIDSLNSWIETKLDEFYSHKNYKLIKGGNVNPEDHAFLDEIFLKYMY